MVYCKNCGKSLDEGVNFCFECGTKVGEGNKYCKNCGVALENSNFCSNCGDAVENSEIKEEQYSTEDTSNTKKCNYVEYKDMNYNDQQLYTNKKSKIVAGILGILIGYLGIHRFYLGYIGIGILQIVLTICTCGLAGLWGFIEGILILCGTGITTDAQGNTLAD